MKSNLSYLKNDIPASIVVFFVAIPLCLGIALASGAPLFSGLIAGIIGGIVVGAISGSEVGVSGPAAGLAAIVLAAISSLGGYQNFLVAVVLGGVIQILFGVLRAGIIGYYFPSSVIKGMLTGIGIIIYSNQPPNEPRERDYVLAGSFFTYCIWIGMGVLALFDLFRSRLKQSGPVSTALASVIVLIAPALMGFQNFDDHSRRHLAGSRDYASNFLNSCEENAIIFTYGDNDTYPLWYAQEVEGVRKDVRVVNLSLLAVDWYIDQLRRKVNDAPPVKMTIPREAYRGFKRNQMRRFQE